MENNLNIVVYTGGTCGDLVGAIIDPQCASIQGATMFLDPLQQRLKKPHNFSNDEEKDNYINDIKFKSIVSHDIEYHKRKNHRFISVIVDDFSLAMWAASRFKNLHRHHVWEEMQQVGKVNTVEGYAQLLIDYSNMAKLFATYTINLSDITSGQAIKKLTEIVEITNISTALYEQWLSANKLYD
jgi:hypothetical protein